MEAFDLKTVTYGFVNLIVAAVLTAGSRWLHKRSMAASAHLYMQSIQAFREELAEERKVFREALAMERDVCRAGYSQLNDRLVQVHQEVLLLKERDK